MTANKIERSREIDNLVYDQIKKLATCRVYEIDTEARRAEAMANLIRARLAD